MARTLEHLAALQLGALHFQVLSLTAQCEKQQDEIADLKKQLAEMPTPESAKPDRLVPSRRVPASRMASAYRAPQ